MALSHYRERFSAFTGSARTREVMSGVVSGAEVMLGGLALGVYEGKMGSAKMYLGADETKPVGESGVPLALVVGLAGHVIGAVTFGTGYSRHIRAVADGALAVYGNHLGKGMGQKMAEKDEGGPPALVAGAQYDAAFGPVMGASAALRAAMTPSQLATVERVARASVR